MRVADSMRTVVILACAVGVASWSGPAAAADANKPHPHQGSIEGYDEFPEIILTEDQLKDLGKKRWANSKSLA